MPDRQRHNTTEVQLPQNVVDRIEARLPRTRFDSVDAYAASALDLLLREVTDGTRETRQTSTAADLEAAQAQEDGSVDASERRDGDATEQRDDGGTMDAADRDAIEDQLESLGYL